MRTSLKTTISVLCLAGVIYWLAYHFEAREKGADFPEFYAAAKMVQAGEGRRLYDFSVQDQFQILYAGRIGVYFNHPPFEAWLYVPFALWPLPVAYGLWCAANAIALAWIAKWLSMSVLPVRDFLLLTVAAFLFVPLVLNFLQGQDSVLLLFLETAALAALHQDKDQKAGALLGLALFKFHLLLPLVLVLAIHRGARILRGFIPVSLGLVLISVLTCGWKVVWSFPRFLIQQSAMPYAGIHPTAMGNIRGLIALLHIGGAGGLIATVVLSVVVLGIASSRRFLFDSNNSESLNLLYSTGVLTTVLVSYHLSPHDLTILLLPLVVLAKSAYTGKEIDSRWRIALLVLVTILALPPLHLWLLASPRYASIALPILALYGLTLVWSGLVAKRRAELVHAKNSLAI